MYEVNVITVPSRHTHCNYIYTLCTVRFITETLLNSHFDGIFLKSDLPSDVPLLTSSGRHEVLHLLFLLL